MSDITKQDLVDALAPFATKQDLTNALQANNRVLTEKFDAKLDSTKQDLATAIKASEKMIVGAVGQQLESITDTMVTKGDLKASERRQSITIEKALTKHVVTWHAKQLR